MLRSTKATVKTLIWQLNWFWSETPSTVIFFNVFFFKLLRSITLEQLSHLKSWKSPGMAATLQIPQTWLSAISTATTPTFFSTTGWFCSGTSESSIWSSLRIKAVPAVLNFQKAQKLICFAIFDISILSS